MFTQAQNEGFETFVDGIETHYWISSLQSQLLNNNLLPSDRLDFSIESLGIVEDFLFLVNEGKLSVEGGIAEIKTWVAAYLGEYCIEIAGGNWVQYPHKDKFNGYPVVDNWAGEGVYHCVFQIIDRALRKSERGRLIKSTKYIYEIQEDKDKGLI